MLEELSSIKRVKCKINLNPNKKNIWIMKEIDKNSNQKFIDNKNIISYGALSLYLKKMDIKKPKTITKYYEIKMGNINEDIFPLERNPNMNFIYCSSNKENLFGENNNIRINSNLDLKIAEYKKKIIDKDIPEMILYKYKYDQILFEEINEDIEDEANFIIKIFRNNNKFIDTPNDEINSCINSIFSKHKKEFYDIPYIVKKFDNIYNRYFSEDEVIKMLSLYDAKYIKYKLKQNIIKKIYNQALLITNNRYKLDLSYINNSENELDLDLVLSYLGFLISIYNNNSKDKFCKSLMNLNINLNCKKLLQIILEDGCDKIADQFCLSPEEVVHNLKILKNEIFGDLKEPNNDCQLMDICLNKVNELSQRNKKYHPLQLLQKAINYHIISLSSHPYISKKIFETYLKITTLSTSPTEKGRIILNSSHPSYRCKRIEKCPLEKFINCLKKNENNFSELYLDMEKCEKEGLINIKLEIDISSKNVEELISLLNKAINGFIEEKKEINMKNNDNKESNNSESDENESDKTKSEYRKNITARKIAVKNMIIEKEFTQKYFINYIKKELHNISERYLMEKITKKFYSIITRKYINNYNSRNEDDTFYYSMFFINLSTFCCICIDKNKKIKYHNIFKSFFITDDNSQNEGKKMFEMNDLNKEMMRHRPKNIILGINNIAIYQFMDYLKDNYGPIIVYSDYLSLLDKPKKYDTNISEEDYFYKIAFDQYKFTINPVEFFIENYNFKYEKNLILNLKLDYLQDQISDIPLLNYCLETQIRIVANNTKFKFPKEKNTPENYFCFMNGLGPITGKLIEENKNLRTIGDIKSIFKKNISKNFEEFLKGENDMDIDDNENEINTSHNFIYYLNEEEIFNTLICSYTQIKKNSIYNVFVNNIDKNNNEVNCVLFFNENILQCKLPFDNINKNILDKEKFFKNHRIILCKIIDLKITEKEYSIILSNKIEDLEYYNKLSFLDEMSYLNKTITDFEINEEEDYKLPEIQKLKKIVYLHKNENRNNKLLKKIKEEGYLKNTSLSEIKKEYIGPEDYGRFCIRPSFMGTDHLILTFSICENINLNYDIFIDDNKNYIIENNNYNSIDDLVKNFANQLLKKINEFKSNKYFRTPSKMNIILNYIFNNINNKYNDYKKINFIDDIIICFMEDSPKYGIFFTKTKNNNYIIDYIEFLPKGFYFHNTLFENISLIIDYYNENCEKEFYKQFICNQIIGNIHSLVEEIDIEYDKFEEEKNVDDLDWSRNKSNNDMNYFNENYSNKNKFLGKKLKDTEFKGWPGNKNNENTNQDGWGDNNFDLWEGNIKGKFMNLEESKNTNKNNNLDNWKKNNNNYNIERNKNDNWGENNNNDIDSWGGHDYNNNNNWENNINKNKKNNSQNYNNINNNGNNSWGNNFNNNNLNNWGNSFNSNNNNNNYKKNQDNDTNIISSEKISNNFNNDKNNENNLWNNSNHNNNKSWNNTSNKSKKNKRNTMKENKQSNFTGWDTGEVEQKNEEDESKYEKNDYNDNNNDIWGTGFQNNENNFNENDTNENNAWSEEPKNMDNYWNTNNSNNNENEVKNNNINLSSNNNNKNENKESYNNNWFDNKKENSIKNNDLIFNCSNNNFYKPSPIKSNNFNKNKFNNNHNYNNRQNNFSHYDRNNNNNFNKKGNNNFVNQNKKKVKFSWKNQLNKDNDIKEDDEDDGKVINFEGNEIFGGYNIKDNEKEKQDKEGKEGNNTFNQEKKEEENNKDNNNSSININDWAKY